MPAAGRLKGAPGGADHHRESRPRRGFGGAGAIAVGGPAA
ncbi:MAG: hypothetical protein AVDCRST_MAG59-5051 [uncultured Thermomicrobiales bacterium]|uniref:Uncharacterized protein n=1 Tax=uncultured Thermomicrobiales bacterium TaxID=1645740 RepID=A0A6J4VMW0_9BACT|nr:MAG: hypothetical protein AVDCRST_MAG59-5051 [uncultured Thermomicrobiales bacterium]